mmetsp:Transcript_22934/g.64035  ORF Transcript_22934/g.64035 Transcript_22934/m.64035 type:complete len:211 (+) Transcript_22934:445-1077(+)
MGREEELPPVVQPPGLVPWLDMGLPPLHTREGAAARGAADLWRLRLRAALWHLPLRPVLLPHPLADAQIVLATAPQGARVPPQGVQPRAQLAGDGPALVPRRDPPGRRERPRPAGVAARRPRAQARDEQALAQPGRHVPAVRGALGVRPVVDEPPPLPRDPGRRATARGAPSRLQGVLPAVFQVPRRLFRLHGCGGEGRGAAQTRHPVGG